MNQEQRNEHIQHARSELRAGRTVMARWPTPGTRGQHTTRVMLAGIQDFATHMVPFDAVTFEWAVPVVEVPAEVVVEPELTPGQKAEAFLVEQLTPDPVPANEVKRLAELAGIKPRTLRRTRERMKIRVFKKGRDCWCWELPGEEDVRP
jgi:hypothetical protein